MSEGLRERKKARTHQGIVDAAVEVFRERGYEKTTVEEIVRRVEISQPTFYKYFGSKDAVLREVAGGMLRESQQYGAITSSNLESYWIGAGITWRFGRGACERLPIADDWCDDCGCN